MAERAGVVLATCLSARSGVPKYPQPLVRVTEEGVEGDYHSGPVNKHKKGGDPEPNHRAVSIVAREVYDDVAGTLEILLEPGAFAENFLTQGLGDLSDLVPGDRIRLGADVVIEVSGQNSPCSALSIHHADIVSNLVGRRGIVGTVVRPGKVQPGDDVEIIAEPRA